MVRWASRCGCRSASGEANALLSSDPRALAEWERDLYQPAGTQQSTSSEGTAAEVPAGEASVADAGEVAVAADEAPTA